MKGDFSKWENKKIKETINFRSVLHQQGKILTDYDWNTQSKLDDEWQDNSAGDILGRRVVAIPAELPEAFKVKSAIVSDGSVKVGIAQGRGWMGGLLTYLVGDGDEIAVRTATYFDLSDTVPPPTVDNIGNGIRDAVVCEIYREEINGFQLPKYLIEPALGGPDTTERINTAMEFKLLRLNNDDSCDSIAKRLREDDSKKGKLKVSLTPTKIVTNDCNCPTIKEGGYTGFEHRLCRIEIAKVKKTITTPMFKYSSFNGGLVGRGIFDLANNKVIISSNLQAIVSSGQSSFYLEVIRYDSLLGTWTVTFGDASTLTDHGELILSGSPIFGSKPDTTDDVFFRLWDEIRKIDEFTSEPGELLKEGIHVSFESPTNKNYRPGDCWTFSVRAGGISNEEVLINNESPHGIQYYRVPLGILKWNDIKDVSDSQIEDCREIFKPVTDTMALYYVSGDGQEAPPGTKLPFPLIVGVTKLNNTPVSNISIRFTITQGNGTLENGQSTMTVLTGKNGLASCTWKLGVDKADQQVSAEMLNDKGAAVHVPVLFNAKSEINQGNCTIVIHPGDDIKSLIDKELPNSGGKVCFSAGTFLFKEIIHIENRNDLLFEGTGSATKIIINNAETAFLFSNCNRIHVNRVYIQSVSPSPSKKSSKPLIKGVLTFLNCNQVKVTNSTFVCNRRFVHTQSCLMFNNEESSPGSQIEISSCTFHVGSMQDGILLVNTRNVIINNNFIDIVSAIVKPTFALKKSLVFKNNPIYRDFVFALGKVGKQVALSKKALNISKMVKKSLEQGISLQKSGKPSEALDMYRKALEIHDKAGDLFEKTVSTKTPNDVRSIFKKIDTDHKAISSSLNKVISAVGPVDAESGPSIPIKSESDESLTVFKEALAVNENVTKSLTQGVSRLSALKNAGKEVALSKKALNISKMVKKSLEQGISLQKSGKPSEALDMYRKALEIHDKAGDLFEKTVSTKTPNDVRSIFKKIDTDHKAISSSLNNGISIASGPGPSPSAPSPSSPDIALPDASIKVFEESITKYDNITSSLTQGVSLLLAAEKNTVKNELSVNRNALFSAIIGDLDNRAFSPNILKFINAVNNDLVMGYQGIVIGGSSADNLQVCNNTISGMIEGIHAGASISDPKKQITKFIKQLSICGNKIELKIPKWHSGQKHGVFIGNTDIAHIKDNSVTVERVNNTNVVHSDVSTISPIIGIQVFGVHGKMTLLSGNMVSNTDTGIRFCTVNFLPQHDSKRVLRLISQNIVYGSPTSYDLSGSVDIGSIKFANHDNIP